jgi:hypothetical protein
MLAIVAFMNEMPCSATAAERKIVPNEALDPGATKLEDELPVRASATWVTQPVTAAGIIK